MNVLLLLFAVFTGDDPTPARSETDPANSVSGAAPERNTPHERPPERPSDAWRPRDVSNTAGGMEHCGPWTLGPFVSVQVNVDGNGCNILGDAANEPSIAASSKDPSKIVIGFRQFDTIFSNFRQAGYSYSHDAGEHWTFPGVLEPGVFRTDPVLAADSDGNIYYLSMVSDAVISFAFCDLWRTTDGGASWDKPIYAFGGDKAWFAIDNTGGIGDGNVYSAWDSYSCCGSQVFTRSIDRGATFEEPLPLPGGPEFGTVAVGPDGELYISGVTATIVRSLDAPDPQADPTFENLGEVDLGGLWAGWAGPNPGGLLGQSWVAVDHSPGSFRGYVYALTSVQPSDSSDPLDAMFARSTSRGVRWSAPQRVNDDSGGNGAYQWFATLSVAPNGRIDVIWNDTRNGPDYRYSELHYSASVDAGRTWSPNVPVSPMFNSWLGWPNQAKIGDYYHSISDREGVSVAYAATFNGEQDVYYLRIPADCDADGIPDAVELVEGTALDGNADGVPDSCEPDIDADDQLDIDDLDIDADGVANSSDRCPFGPFGFRIRPDGSPFSDQDRNCRVDLLDHQWWATVFDCFDTSGPGVPVPSRACREGVDFDADGDVDLIDVATYQRIFGRDGG